ncbi:MAG TPA: DUF1963 domain-containing protein [Baekduia sp.]|nr:DUF1963 domain-containing protein [Baekduia sp.]
MAESDASVPGPEPDLGGSSRRGFLRDLMRTGAKGATQAATIAGPPGLQQVLAASGRAATPSVSQPAVPAPTGTTTVDELLGLAHAGPLAERTAVLRGLAEHSLRLTPIASGEPDAWLGGTAQGLAEYPEWGEQRLTLLAQIDLSSSALEDTVLRADARLLLFFDAKRAPSGLQAGAAGSARAIVLDNARLRPRGGTAAALDGELMLPRVWHASVQALGLSDAEHDAYVALRDALAEAQGVPPDGTGIARLAHHRLLGYPNETSGDMPLACELTARGLDADDPSATDPDVVAGGQDWRLLAQISMQPQGRIYFWIRSRDLHAGNFDDVWAFAR